MENKLLFNKFLFGILLLFTILKIAIVFSFSDANIKLFEDHTIAVNWIETGTFFYPNDGTINHSFQFPLYPAILAGLYTLTGIQPIVALLFNILVYSLACLLLVRFVQAFIERNQLHFNSKWLNVLALVIMVYPFTNLYTLTCVHPFAFNFILIALFLRCSELYLKNNKYAWLLGIVFGVVLFQRSSLLGLILYPFICNWQSKNISIQKWITILLIASILPIIWSYRNYQKDDVFGMTSTTGKILWKGSLIGSDGSNYIDGNSNYYDYVPDSVYNRLAEMSVKEQDQAFKTLWKANWNDNASEQIQHYFKKLLNFWGFREGFGTEYQSFNQLFYLYQWGYAVLLFMVVLLTSYYRKFLFPILAPLILLSLFQAFFYVETRHRIIYEPILLMILFLGLFGNIWSSQMGFVSKTK